VPRDVLAQRLQLHRERPAIAVSGAQPDQAEMCAIARTQQPV
jgi:hypothetical protein